MPAPTFPPSASSRVKVVASFAELIATPFANGINALCWPRTLPGDFREIASLVEGTPGIATVEESTLLALTLSEQGRVARDILLADLALLRSAELTPVLDSVTGAPRPTDDGYFPTDVYSYHADSADGPADTYICTYTGACTDALVNEEAIARVDIPETRAALLALHGGPDDETFRDFLNENFYDLHYLPRPHAQPYSFGRHHLWRVALDHPGSVMPPCIHRAPLTLPGMPSRLLLLS